MTNFDKMYKKIKRQNGENFAKAVKNYHNGILEIPGIDKIVKHAGREAEPVLAYLVSLLENDGEEEEEVKCPFALLSEAGYDAFHADTLKKQNSIKPYFAKGEGLCTFSDTTRYQKYHIVNAVRKDVDDIKREDFRGKEKRQDEYGTSVISIQMLKNGGFISIKNRYNHKVPGCDNTFNSNPDNIIKGLSAALKHHFKADFSTTKAAVSDGFTIVDGCVFKYHKEINNVYYGHDAWAKDGRIHAVDKSAGDGLFDYYLFVNKDKKFVKIDPTLQDSFPDDFNRDYGGDKNLFVVDGNLVLKES